MSAEFVSYETAKALKAAGYPQPERGPGQLWYGTRFMGGTESYNTKCFVGAKGNLMFTSNGNGADLIDYPVYIPDLTDLLNFAGPSWGIRAMGLGEFEIYGGSHIGTITKNPAETLARLILQSSELFLASTVWK